MIWNLRKIKICVLLFAIVTFVVIAGIYVNVIKKGRVKDYSTIVSSEPSIQPAKDANTSFFSTTDEDRTLTSANVKTGDEGINNGLSAHEIDNQLQIPDGVKDKADKALMQLQILSWLPPVTDKAKLFVPDIFPNGVKEPSVSPDGENVAIVVNNEDKTSDVYLYSIKQRSLRNLTEALPIRGPYVSGPKFSSDGKTVLVSGFPDSGLWTVDVQTGEARLLVDNKNTIAPNWSFDGNYITYTCVEPYGKQSWIEIFDVKNNKVVNVLKAENNATVAESSFSPNGENLAYVRIERKQGKMIRSLVIKSLRTGEETVSSFSDHDIHTPVFSRDGKYIAYRGGSSAYGEIYVYSMKNGTEKRVTGGSGSYPCWSSDSKSLIFASYRVTGRAMIYQVDISATEETK